jgi:hypothetical protein
MLHLVQKAASTFQVGRQPGQKSCACLKITLRRCKPNLKYVFLRFPFFSHCCPLQGPTVQGEVSLTCDAWQASNTDGYFSVTAHWIKEPMPGKWELKSALIGFTRLNNAHNGHRLGQALFKVIKRVGIEHKVSKVMLLYDELSCLSSYPPS